MRQTTSDRATSDRASEGVGATTASGSPGPVTMSVLEPVTAWKEAAAATGRWWTMVGVGLGALACLAVAGAAVRALAGPSPSSLCSDGVSCNAAGVSYTEAPDASDEDLKLSARLFQRACDLGHGPACNNLGLAHQSARGVPLDYERALTAFERACSLGFGEGCNNQGTLYEHGRAVPVNMGDAQRLYNQACRRGSALGCSNLGVLYAEGRGVAPDPAVAAQLFSEACTAGIEVACTNLLATGQASPQPEAADPPPPEASASDPGTASP